MSYGRAAHWLALVFGAWLAIGSSSGAAQQPVPPLTGRVVDATATLTPEALAGFEAKLTAFEQRKGSQIAVLLVRTTAPEAIEEYSLRVAEQWRIGRGGVPRHHAEHRGEPERSPLQNPGHHGLTARS